MSNLDETYLDTHAHTTKQLTSVLQLKRCWSLLLKVTQIGLHCWLHYDIVPRWSITLYTEIQGKTDLFYSLLIMQDSPNDIFLLQVGVCLLVPKGLLLEILFFLFGISFHLIFSCWFLYMHVKSWINILVNNFIIGMKRISSFWGFAVPLDHKPWCRRLFCQVIACTLDFLLLLPMRLQLIAVLLYFTIQGDKKSRFFVLSNSYISFLLICLWCPGLVHLSLSYPYQNTLKQYFTHVFQLGCDFGCFLRLKSQVSEGNIAIHGQLWY